MENEIYYKVVSYQGKKYLSITESSAEVEYKINEWVKSPIEGSALAVFDNIEHAMDFKYFSTKIFECLIKKSNSNYLSNGSRITYSDSLPYGTVFADEVMLLSEVEI